MAEGGGEEKASGGTPDVLITYASQDAAVANTVWTAVRDRGHARLDRRNTVQG